jgi:GDP-L-fucose synthase
VHLPKICHLLSGALEETNEAYAIAKIAGLMTAQAYRKQFGFNAISLMPTNLYGPWDTFDFANAHVIPALLRKIHDAKISNAPEIVVWGTGTPRREFLHVDDLADAALHLIGNYNEKEPVNVGTGNDITIAELAGIISEVIGFEGSVRFDTSKPDGTPRKLLDVSRLTSLGWRSAIGVRDGIASTYTWFKEALTSGAIALR